MIYFYHGVDDGLRISLCYYDKMHKSLLCPIAISQVDDLPIMGQKKQVRKHIPTNLIIFNYKNCYKLVE